MIEKINKWLPIVTFVWLVVLTVVLVGGNQPENVNNIGVGSRFPNGISADSTSPSAGQVRGTTLTSTGAATVGTTLTATGGASTLATTTVNGLLTISSNAVSTTTTGGTAATLSQADLLAGQYYTVNVSQAADFTYTLPATSTMTSLLANTGESASWCFDNATSTAGIDLIFAAGSGWDFEVATSTSVLEYAGASDLFCIDAYKKANTDVFGVWRSSDDSD